MTRRQADHRDERGFTLLELTMGLVLLGIMALIALPNLQYLTGRNRVLDAARQLESGMQSARMAAINEQVDHVVQFTANGWNVYRDLNGNGTRETGEAWLMTTPTLLPPNVRFAYPDAAGQTALATASLATAGCRCIRFRPNGTIAVAASTVTTGSLALGDRESFRRINVSTAGAVRLQNWNRGRSNWE